MLEAEKIKELLRNVFCVRSYSDKLSQAVLHNMSNLFFYLELLFLRVALFQPSTHLSNIISDDLNPSIYFQLKTIRKINK